MNLLDRYVMRALLGGVLVVIAVLLSLGALFLFANQQDAYTKALLAAAPGRNFAFDVSRGPAG